MQRATHASLDDSCEMPRGEGTVMFGVNRPNSPSLSVDKNRFAKPGAEINDAVDKNCDSEPEFELIECHEFRTLLPVVVQIEFLKNSNGDTMEKFITRLQNKDKEEEEEEEGAEERESDDENDKNDEDEQDEQEAKECEAEEENLIHTKNVLQEYYDTKGIFYDAVWQISEFYTEHYSDSLKMINGFQSELRSRNKNAVKLATINYGLSTLNEFRSQYGVPSAGLSNELNEIADVMAKSADFCQRLGLIDQVVSTNWAINKRTDKYHGRLLFRIKSKSHMKEIMHIAMFSWTRVLKCEDKVDMEAYNLLRNEKNTKIGLGTWYGANGYWFAVLLFDEWQEE